MFFSLYFEMIIVASLLKVNLEMEDPKFTTLFFLCVSYVFSLMMGVNIFAIAFLILMKAPVAYLCFWGVKKLESQHLAYWGVGVLFASQILMRAL